MGALSDVQEIRELITRCLSGDREASRLFQQTYGELIYGYPIRVYRIPAEDAGDFYVFAFEEGRIFRRLRTYEGRAPFRAYLLGFVLDYLVLEWKRGSHDVETVSLEELGELPEPEKLNGDAPGDASGDSMDRAALAELLATLEPSKAVVMKLLYIEDFELNAAEIRHLAEVSGRSVGDALAGVNRLRATVREREATLKSVEDHLDAVHAWIQLYERRLQRIAEDLTALPPSSTAAARLREEQSDLQRKIQRRQQQRAKLVTRMQRRKVTAPYKEIGALLNTTVGNVGSQIARAREELAQRAGVTGQALGIGGQDG